MPPFLSIEDGTKTISVPRAPVPPPTFYDRLAKYASDHPYVVTSGALSVAALAVGLGYSLQDEDSFLRVKSRNWMGSRGNKDKDGKSGYKLGSESGSSFLAGLRGGKPHHPGFLQRRADRLKGRKVDGMLKDAILILAPSPFPQLLLPLILSLLNNDYIVFIAVPKSKDADELEKKIKLNEKVKAKGLSVSVRVMVYDPAEVSLPLRFATAVLITSSLNPSNRFNVLCGHHSLFAIHHHRYLSHPLDEPLIHLATLTRRNQRISQVYTPSSRFMRFTRLPTRRFELAADYRRFRPLSIRPRRIRRDSLSIARPQGKSCRDRGQRTSCLP